MVNAVAIGNDKVTGLRLKSGRGRSGEASGAPAPSIEPGGDAHDALAEAGGLDDLAGELLDDRTSATLLDPGDVVPTRPDSVRGRRSGIRGNGPATGKGCSGPT